jgi:hypothetical protein
VSKLPTGALDKDLKYMTDIEIEIREWNNQELDKSQLIQVSSKAPTTTTVDTLNLNN